MRDPATPAARLARPGTRQGTARARHAPVRRPGRAGGDLPPLPPPPPTDDEDFDPDDEDMSASAVNELTGMALVQRELGAQVIAEYDD